MPDLCSGAGGHAPAAHETRRETRPKATRALPAKAVADSGIYYAAALLSDANSFTGTLNSNPYDNEAAFSKIQVFVDSSHPSPIQHPYIWSSLGVNGSQDAYTVKLGITFAAQYRVTVSGNGAGTNGWRSLQERELSWTTSHRVQEAQAVLTRP